MIGRREFITLLGGAAAGWPLAARAQQGERMRRIGLLMTTEADDPESLARVGAFQRGLRELGWTDGRNVRIEYRWGSGNADRIRNPRRNWSRSRLMSFWPMAPPPWDRCNKRPAASRSCS